LADVCYSAAVGQQAGERAEINAHDPEATIGYALDEALGLTFSLPMIGRANEIIE
jgi:hypothetical protein